ncbi:MULTISPECIES: TetR/AcrR family transcriptional regulator [Rhodococcus]|uniref:TetR/AcrR family transcriptional regulator n=1 Tax=Rhodococcus oxybenzonivorans TaxID=1990687 RepID=A0AAE5A9E1_9NOCA|nr:MULTISPECIES: TetR/AcrR family transcriptional regulator [Rhodococcus]MDV7243565.1 TetR/AcrR family transcriptional regulator [Rhodococcus oxybenzonivorans]MDV7268940.1 TetR/AcrR family transcriptional regulator [Rhodococcus oxybenzonivorans]MDV7277541.1 TetR/AcrR family transcriptional regulator [Rhodococcus oxybenzonivorans]MDV7335431.1 TetR/AcrR family transcriptional regulator [Rhodococcus oxybenzonivorans]MDV7347253.1 TetR/AcrR family transcriptional regulator [Rhodococcus oxybenzonivo
MVAMVTAPSGSTGGRMYGGQEGDARRAERRAQLIEAGLDLLGSDDGDHTLSVRGVCKRAGLATRYFYESFTDRDALIVAVYDHVVQRIATSTLEAVSTAGPGEREIVEAGVRNIVRAVAEDPRHGRLMFSVAQSSEVLAQRRLDSSRLFAGLVTKQTVGFYEVAESPRLDLAAHFMVGGLAQTLTAWLNGTVTLPEEDLVNTCTDLLLSMAIHTR